MTIQVTGREGHRGLVLISEIAALFECAAEEAPNGRAFVMIIFKSGDQIAVYNDFEKLSKAYLKGLTNA